MFLHNSKRTITILIVFLPLVLTAQSRSESIMHVDSVISFYNEEYTEGIVASQYGSKVAFTNYNVGKSSDTIVFYVVDMDNYSVDTQFIYRRNICRDMKERGYRCLRYFAYNGKYISLPIKNRMYIYGMGERGGQLLFDFKIDEDYSTMSFMDEKNLVLSENYYSRRHPNTLMIYDVEKGKRRHIIYPYFNSPMLSYFQPFKNVDVQKGLILWANRNEYSFVIYDSQLRKVDSVYFGKRGWRPLSEKTIEKVKSVDKHEAQMIMDYVAGEYDKTCRLSWAFLLETDKVAVCTDWPKDEKGNTAPARIDVWQKKAGHWALVKEDVKDGGYIGYKGSDTITMDNMPLNFKFGNLVFFYGNKIVTINPRAASEHFFGKTLYERYVEEQAYLKQHNYFTQVMFYSFDF